MERIYFILDNDNRIINIIVSSKEIDNYLNSLYSKNKKFSIVKRDDFEWKIGENIYDELNRYYYSKIENLNNENFRLKHEIKILSERLDQIEELLIHEILFSPTFGKEQERIYATFLDE